jgi:hypothetical protein
VMELDELWHFLQKKPERQSSLAVEDAIAFWIGG